MRVEYKRDMNHNYLILCGEQDVDTASYQVRMLAGNVLPSILRCRLQGLDGKILFYYEITSRQSIASLYEQKKFGREDLQLIFSGFVQVMEEMGEYLLNPGQLVIDPDYIFMDVEKKGMYFCYLPGYEKDVREQLQTFTEYILPKLDHEDGRAVILGYGIYRRALEETFHLEHIKQELYQVREENLSEVPSQEEIHPGEEDSGIQESDALGPAIWCREKPEKTEREDKKRENIEENTKKGSAKNKNEERKSMGEKNVSASDRKSSIIERAIVVIAVIIVAAVMMGILAANLLGYLPWLSIEMTMGAGLVLLGSGVLAYLISRKKKAKEEENWRRKVQKNREIRKTEDTEENDISENKYKEEGELPRCFPDMGKQEQYQEWKETCSEVRPREENAAGEVGETVVLSANVMCGPASLVSKEPGELAPIYLKEELTVIGKLETACDAVIPLPTVSRIHGKIRKRGDDFYLTDLNSKNGTCVNGRMLKADEEYQLQDEDEVDFAQARYVFVK